jgi:hypothetical protein
MRNTPVSREQAAELERRLPGLTVQRD